MLPCNLYKVTIRLIAPMLGTNPADPTILDTHIIERQRKIILDKSAINTEIERLSTYLGAEKIDDTSKAAQIKASFDKLEALTGYDIGEDERSQILAGNLEMLRETFAELDLRGTTVFFWNKELARPMIGRHMIKGFLKSAAKAFGRLTVDEEGGGKKTKKKGEMISSISYTSSIINTHCTVAERFVTFDKDVVRNSKDGHPQYLQRALRAETMKGERVTLVKSEMVGEDATLSFTLKVLKGSPLTEDIIRSLFDYGEMVGLGQWRNSGYGSFTYDLTKIPS